MDLSCFRQQRCLWSFGIPCNDGSVPSEGHRRAQKRSRAPRVLGLGLLAACGSEATFLEAPEGVAYVGALLVSEQGDRGTMLSRVQPRAQIEVPDGHSAFIYGFDARSLELALGRSASEPELAGALRASVGCEPRLPKASWIEAVVGTTGPAIAKDAAPRITAAWVQESCPQPNEAVATPSSPRPVPWPGTDAGCTGLPCATYVTGCRLDIDLDTCVTGARKGRGSIGVDGEVCLELEEGCRPARALSGVDQRYECAFSNRPAACTIDAYGATSPLSAEVLVTELHPGRAPIDPPAAYIRGTLNLGLARRFAVLESTVVVASPGPRDLAQPRETCLGLGPSVLSFVDPSDLSLTHTATAPTCLADLAAEAGGQTFLAVYGTWPEIYLGRFDAGGRELERKRLEPPASAPPEIAYSPVAIDVSPAGHIAIVLRDRSSGVTSQVPRHEILLVLTPSFETLVGSSPLDADLLQVEFEDDETITLLDHRDRSLRWFELPSVTETGRARVSNVTRAADVVHAAVIGARQAVLATSGQFGRFGRVEADLENDPALRPWAWGDAEAGASSPWPLDPDLRLVSLRVRRLGDVENLNLSALALFSLREGRYLPVASIVGEHGIGAPAEQAQNGDIFILYPWTGRLMRVRPKP